MAYKRYFYRNGKKFGPYYYESYRDKTGKVRKKYVGVIDPDKKKFKLNILSPNYTQLVLLAISLAIFTIILIYSQTHVSGFFSLNIPSAYIQGESISGNIELSLKSGELLPLNSKLIVSQGENSREIELASLITSNAQGNFYLEGKEILGEGEGYGFAGEKIIYPEVFFKLKILESEILNETIPVENETEIVNDTVETPVENETLPIEEPIQIPETPETPIETPIETPVETPVENPEAPVEETPIETPIETPAETPSESPITGQAILEQDIDGSCSKGNDFIYNLAENENAEIISGSVKTGDKNLEDKVINFEILNSNAKVSTDYSETIPGFGQEFLGNENKIEIDLNKLNILAVEGTLKISLVYDNVTLAETSKEIIVSVENETLPIENLTIINETEINETILIINKTSLKQYKAVIGKPVKWLKIVTIENSSEAEIEIPKEAENISIKQGEEVGQALQEAEASLITGNAIKEDELIGKIKEKDNKKIIDLKGQISDNEEVAVEYYTEAPEASEELIANGKRVTISAPDELGYTDVLAYSQLDNKIKVGSESQIKLRWVNENQYVAFNVDDLDSDGYIDYIGWNVPHLSEQVYEIIYITKAVKLDSGRNFVSDVYEQVKAQDGTYESFSDGEYLRVTFEQELDSSRDITLYARSNDSASIEVYVENSSELIATIENITNEDWYKVYLIDLNGSYPTFDLRILGNVEIDYVVDPAGGITINFTNPTFTNNTRTSVMNAEINISMNNAADLNQFKFNSNGVNYTFYNNSLVLMMNMNNNSAIGENATRAVDVSNFSNNGTLINGASWTTSGKYGAGVQFDGVDDYIKIPDTRSLDFGTGPVTIMAWVKPGDVTNGQVIYHKGSALGCSFPASYLYFAISSDILELGVGCQYALGAGGYDDVHSTDTVPKNSWHHVAVTVTSLGGSASDYRFYIDGVDARAYMSNDGSPAGSQDSGYPALIGAGRYYNYADPSYFYNGSIDEVKVYKRNMSAAEIQQQYYSNLYKYNQTSWNFYTNQPVDGNYSAFGCAKDALGNENCTETRNGVFGIPAVNFTNPTFLNNTRTSAMNAEVNISITEGSLGEMKFNSNGTNYTFYDNNLKLMMNLNNISSLGENSTNAVDVSKYSNNGTLYNGVNWTNGEYGMGLGFDGSNDYVLVPDSTSIKQTSQMSFETWVKFGALKNNDILFWKAGEYGMSYNYTTYMGNTAKINFATYDGSLPWQNVNSITSPISGVWYHVVGVANSTNITIYINGIAENVSTRGAVVVTTNPLYLGLDTPVSAGYFNGVLDEFRIYNYSLSAAEVKQHYYSNLYKYNSTQWNFYSNQPVEGNYSAFGCAKDTAGNENCTETRNGVFGIPAINFTNPTPGNATSIAGENVEINISITEAELNKFIWNWNGTNYTFYNSSLLLMLNLNNISTIGENATHAVDVSLYSNNATLYNGAKWNATGRYGSALTFDGINDYAQIPASDTFNVRTGNFAIEMWVYWNSITGEQFLLNKDEISGRDFQFYKPTDHRVFFHPYDGVGEVQTDANVVVSGRWYHIVFSREGTGAGQAKIYINGILNKSDANPTDIDNAVIMQIGSQRGTGSYFNGTIDEVKIWNRSLTAAEVNQSYYSNLYRYNSTQWNFYSNQQSLTNSQYNYFGCAKDTAGNENCTEMRQFTGLGTAPSINFTNPTLPNGTTTTNTSIQINISITESGLDEMKWNWNGTNYTFYDESLVLMMNFDNVSDIGENATYAVDVSKYGNNGTLYNGAKWNVSGKYGGGVQLDGVNDDVQIPDSSSLSALNGGTWSFWFKTNATFSDYEGMLSKRWGTEGYEWVIETLNNKIYVEFDGAGGTANSMGRQNVKTDAQLADNNWHHVVITWGGAWDYNDIHFYIDGVSDDGTLVASGGASSVADTTAKVRIGSQYSSDYYFNGTIDEVRIYKKNMTAAEAKQHYYSNLYKYDTDKWAFYTNPSNLTFSKYTYFGCAKDTSGNENCTETRSLTILSSTTISNCTTLSVANTIYYLSGTATSSGSCMNITANNITLDCQGNIIDGTDTSGTYGINITNTNYTTIQNCRITDYYNGIYLKDASFGDLINNTVQSNTNDGIYLTSSSNNIFTNNTVNSNTNDGISLNAVSNNNILTDNTANLHSGTTDNGIYLSASSNNTLTGNNVTDNGYGIYLISNSQNNTIDSSTAISSASDGIYLTASSNNILTNNTASASTNDGISLNVASHNNILTGNSVSLHSGAPDMGIYISASSNITLTGNNATDNFNGIYFTASSNNTLIDNIAISNTNDGIYLTASSNNILTNNTASASTNDGISLNAASHNNILTGNIATLQSSTSDIGIFISASSNNTLTSNNVSLNYYGISLTSSSNNTFTNNIVGDNSWWDYYSITSSLSNRVTNLTSYQNSISFTYLDIALKGLQTTGYILPSGQVNVSKYLNIINNSAAGWIFLNVSYADADISGINENSLKIWKYNPASSSWISSGFNGTTGIDTINKVVYANITTFSEFGVFGNEAIFPLINFTNPTPANNTQTTNTSVEINISITEQNLNQFIWNWNGTNYTFYNSSLLLMLNLNNISAIGENETRAVDVSNYGNHGTLYNGARWTTSGKYGAGVQFDGVDDYVDVGMNLTFPSLDAIGNAWSISFWVYANSVNPYLFSKGKHRDGVGFDPQVYSVFSNSDILSLGDSSNRASYSAGMTFNANQWYYLSLVVQRADATNTNVKVYVNGSLTNSANGTYYDYDVNLPLEFGRYTSYTLSPVYFNGTIDEIKIYNRSLSAREIQQQYYSNLYKYDSTSWNFYSNQSNLASGANTYFGCVKDISGNENCTEMRLLNVLSSVSNCANLTQPNSVYYLTQSATSTGTCMNINASNVTLDCQGNTITYGTGGIGWGVNVTHASRQLLSNVTIKNCVIQKTSGGLATNYGVRFYNISNSELINNTIVTNGTSGNTGTYFSYSSGNDILNNTIISGGTTTGNVGVYFELSSSNNNLAGNNISSGRASTTSNHGVYISNSINNSITSNVINASGTGTDYGIYLINSVNATNISYNSISTSGSIATSSDYGIYLVTNCYRNIINSNNISTSGTSQNYGLLIYTSSYNNISSNNITTTGTGNVNYGILINTDSQNNTLLGNFISTNGTNTNYGIHLLARSSGNAVINNTIFTKGTGNDYGVYISNGAISNTFTTNDITTKNAHGIYLQGGSHNRFTGNSVNVTNTTSSEWFSIFQTGQAAPWNNSVTNLTLERSNITISFTDYNGTSIKGLLPSEASYASPSGQINISKYLNISNNSATSWLNINISYTDADISAVQESLLKIWKYNSTSSSWISTGFNSTGGVNTAGKYVYANITTFSTFGIFGDLLDLTAPSINFTNPTPANGTSTTNTFAEINISITEASLGEMKWNWNGTNYTFYNESLVLMMNLNNNSAIGENETYAVDVSKWSNNGTLYNGVKWNSTGKYGMGLALDGINDYVSILDSGSLRLNSNFSMSAWIYLNPLSTYATIFDKDYSDPAWESYSLKIWKNNDADDYKLYSWFYDGANKGPYQSTAKVSTTTWNYVVMNYLKNGTIEFYINGVNAGTVNTGVTNILYDISQLYIGREWGGIYFNGTIDEVRIYNRSLSASEVQQNYYSNLYKYNQTAWIFYSNQQNLTQSNYTYFGCARDNAGNENCTEIRMGTFGYNDTIAPNATYLEPQNATVTNVTWQNFTANFSDDRGLANATLYIYNETGLYNETTYTFIGNPLEYSLGIVVYLTQGIYHWFWMVVDAANNFFTTQQLDEGNRTITIDTTLPLIEFVEPTPLANSNLSQNSIPTNVSVSDAFGIISSITINLYNETTLVNSTSSGTSPFYVNFTGLPYTTYYINASVNDTAGNWNYSETRTINLAALISSQNISECSNLTQKNGVYYLNRSIQYNLTCMQVQANNVTLDCAGYTIDGNDTAGTAGINVTGYNYTTIKNCIVKDYYDGIYFRSSNLGNITNNTLTSNFNGIYLISSSSSNSFTLNNISSNANTGIYSVYAVSALSINNIYTFNTIKGNSNYGMYFSVGNNHTISSNVVNSNNYGIYLADGSSNSTLINNTANSNSNFGISLSSGSMDCILINNTANSNQYGFRIYFSYNNTLISNIANSNTKSGIYLESGSNNMLISNTAQDNTLGDYYSSSNSQNNTVTNLTTLQNLVSFNSLDIALKGLQPASYANPTGQNNISKYLNITNNSAGSWIFLNISYNDTDWNTSVSNEATLKIWKYNQTSGAWISTGFNSTGGVDTTNKYVYANITSFSTFGVFGDEPVLVLPFSATWNTSKVAGSTNVTLPITGGAVTIDWGDGTVETATTNRYHNYSTTGAGLYRINITNVNSTGFRFNNAGDKLKIIDIYQWGDLVLGNANAYFYGCTNLNSTNTITDVPSLFNTTNFNTFFRASGFNGNITGWNTSNVVSASNMFQSATSFNQDISGWDTHNISTMSAMFQSATNFNQNLSSWDTSKVTTMASMFQSATNFNQSLNSWNVSSVTTTGFSNMFQSATNFNQPLDNWKISPTATSFSGMFSLATNFNGDISSWNTSGITTMTSMFQSATNFNQNLSSWDTSKVTSMTSMFQSATNFNQNLSSWDTSKVTSMSYMFFIASNFNQSLNSWNVSSVTTTGFYGMFSSATNFNQPLDNWKISPTATSFASMFSSATNFNGDISSWNTSSITTMTSMFQSATNFNQDLSSWDTHNVTTMASMFYSATNFNQDLSDWNTSKVTTMANLFRSATNFNGNVTNWDTSNVKDMTFMFYQDTAFNQPLNWAVHNVTTFSSMFNGATSYNQPMLVWNAASASSMTGMLINANSFNQDIGAWNVSNVSNMVNMFNSATSFSNINWDKLLAGWSSRPVKPNVILSVVTQFKHSNCSNYTDPTRVAGLPGKLILNDTATNNWTINDGGLNASGCLDITPPNATYLEPQNGTVTNATSQNFTASFSDSGGLANATLSIYNETGLYNETTYTFIGNPLEYSLGIVVYLVQGVYHWFWTVVDAANNAFSTQQLPEGNRTITIDTSTPGVEFVSPTPLSGSNLSQTFIPANVSVSDSFGAIDTITIYLSNATALLNTTTSATSPFYFNFSELNYTTYYINASVNDTAGNWNYTETRTINLISLVYNQNISECSNLTQANTIYNLNTSISGWTGTCMNILANNVTLDCGGYANWIDGDDSGTDYGVNVTGYNYTTIKNCNITDFARGVYSYIAYFVNITNNTVYHNVNYGLYLFNSRNNSITNNTFSGPGQTYAVYLDSTACLGNTIAGNKISSTAYGLSLMNGAANNIISSNNISSNPLFGIQIANSPDNHFYNNVIYTGKNSTNHYQGLFINGFTLSEYSQNISNSNTIDGKPINYSNDKYSSCPNNTQMNIGSDYSWVGLAGCNNVTINGTLSHNLDHVLLAYTTNSQVYHVNVTYTYVGIYISYGSLNNLIENIVNNNDNRAIYLESTLNNTISSNTIYRASVGMRFYLSSNNTVINNTLDDPVNYGLEFSTSSNNNNITSNTIYSAGVRGISMSSSSGNYNSFTSNNISASGSYGIYIQTHNNTITGNSITGPGQNYGIYLVTSSDNNITNNLIENNNLWDYYSTTNSLRNKIINLTSYQNSISFTSLDIALKGMQAGSYSNPSGQTNISKYLNITNNSAGSWIFLNWSYTDSDWQNANIGDESTLRIWKYNSTAWINESFYSSDIYGPNYGVNTTAKYVYANITNFSTFGIFGEEEACVIPSVGGTVSSAQNICDGDSPAQLNLTGETGTVKKWQKSTDGGTTWTNITNTATSYSPGALSVTTEFRAVVKSGGCAEDYSSSATITVAPNLPVSVSNTPSANPACAGANVGFVAAPTNGGSPSYQWKLNGGNVGSDSSSYSSSTLATNDQVYVVMTSSLTCTSGNPANSNTVTMTIKPVPTIDSTTGNSTCAGNSVTLQATASGGTINWYANAEGGESLGTGNSYVTPSLSVTTSYYVDATLDGCTTSSRTSVTATILPLPTPTITGPSIVSGIPSANNTYTTEAGMSNYNWTVSGAGYIETGGSSTDNFVNITWNGTGTKTVNVNYFNGNGCTAAASTELNVIANSASDTPTVTINSTDGGNKTKQNLNCYATITDSNNDVMNVSVVWYKESATALTINYNNNYANGTFFNAILNNENTTKNENWSCGMRLYDGVAYSNWSNSSKLTILNTLPNVTLTAPNDGDITTNRTPGFTWTGSDDDSDALSFDWNLTCLYAGGGTCIAGNRYIDKTNLGSEVNYTPAQYLEYLIDNNYFYNWSIRAHDGDGYGAWATFRNISIQSEVSISLPVAEVNFGAVNNSGMKNTTDGNVPSLVLRNDGNAELNISINATNLFTSQANPSDYFKYKIGNLSAGCFMSSATQITWAQTPSITTNAISRLNFTSGYQTGCNNATIDVHVQVPSDESPGNKSSRITFTASLGELGFGPD